MSISVQNNSDGSVTVRCAGDVVTVYPQATGISGDPNASGGVIPIVSSDDDDPPLTGWPLPGAFQLIRAKTPAFHVQVDPLSGKLTYDHSLLATLMSGRSRFSARNPLTLAIHTKIGEPLKVGDLKVQLKTLCAPGTPLLSYLVADLDGDGS